MSAQIYLHLQSLLLTYNFLNGKLRSFSGAPMRTKSGLSQSVLYAEWSNQCQKRQPPRQVGRQETHGATSAGSHATGQIRVVPRIASS